MAIFKAGRLPGSLRMASGELLGTPLLRWHVAFVARKCRVQASLGRSVPLCPAFTRLIAGIVKFPAPHDETVLARGTRLFSDM